jgi:hypothetical protein
LHAAVEYLLEHLSIVVLGLFSADLMEQKGISKKKFLLKLFILEEKVINDIKLKVIKKLKCRKCKQNKLGAYTMKLFTAVINSVL